MDAQRPSFVTGVAACDWLARQYVNETRGRARTTEKGMSVIAETNKRDALSDTTSGIPDSGSWQKRPKTRARARQAKGGIVLLTERGKTGPIVVCHGCDKRITDYRMAGVVFSYHDPSFRVYCKAHGFQSCLVRFTPSVTPWMELRDFL